MNYGSCRQFIWSISEWVKPTFEVIARSLLIFRVEANGRMMSSFTFLAGNLTFTAAGCVLP
jgi:hypothetical protein